MLQQALLDQSSGTRDGKRAHSVPAAPPRGLTGSIATWVIHPFLFAVYPILAIFAQNAHEVQTAKLTALVGWALLGAFCVCVVFGMLLRDARKGALVTVLAVVFFFTLNLLMEPARGVLDYMMNTFWVRRRTTRLDPLWVIIPEVVLLLGFAFVVVRRLKNLRTMTSFLNLFAIVLVAMPVFQIVTAKAPTAARPPRKPEPFPLSAAAARSRLPDIYYIILDGYARTDVMKSLFDYDNSAFIEHLAQKGFYVARHSTANYCQTPLCLSASLNCVYLDGLIKGLGNSQTELSDLIGKSDVMASLRPLGYKFVTFGTGFDPTEHPEADVYLSPSMYINEFDRMLIDMTPLRRVWPMPGWFDQYTLARQRVFYLLDNLPRVARDRAPTFTLAHLLCPHLPFIFGENGEDVGRRLDRYSLQGGDRRDGRFRDPEDFRKAYRAQAVYITRRIEQTIDRLLAESPEPPIIILQSDHGSELLLDTHDVHHTDLHERMSILSAYYFPGGRYEGLYDSISPVNSFRVVLNTFFGANLPLLPDQSYFSTWSDPYEFIDVTDKVRAGDAGKPSQ
jgi:hypothetical protein